MGVVMSIRTPSKHSWWRHKLWLCKNYWDFSRRYKCPGCNKTMRCYWDGNDVTGHGIDYCNRCAKRLEQVTGMVATDPPNQTEPIESAQSVDRSEDKA